jgi:hypothetical protein
MPKYHLLLALSVATLDLSGCTAEPADEIDDDTGASTDTTGASTDTTGASTDTTDTTGATTTTASPTTGAGPDAGNDELDGVLCEPGDLLACPYSGPPGALGVGVCVQATRVCDEDGRWSACSGEVLPRTEDCRDQLDDDCDGQTACNGEIEWVMGFGEPCDGVPGDVSVHALAVDASGRPWITGAFTESLRFGDEVWHTANDQSYFLVQLDRHGQAAYSYGDEHDGGQGLGVALASDGADGIAAGMYYTFSVKPHADAPIYQSQLSGNVVQSLGAAGDYRWSRPLVSAGTAYGNVLVFDGAGDLWTGGGLYTDTNFGTPALPRVVEHHGGGDAFLARMTPDGEVAWAAGFGDSEHQDLYDLAVDAAGDVWIVGGFAGAMTFVGGSMHATKGEGSSEDMFIVKLGPDGHWRWGKRYGDEAAQAFYEIEITGDGNAIVSGEYTGTVHDLGAKTLNQAAPHSGLVLAQFGPDGEVHWVRDWACTENCDITRLAVDGAGQTVVGVTVVAGNTLTINEQPFTANAKESLGLVVKLDRQGLPLWSEAFPFDPQIAVGAGEVLVAGTYREKASFAGGAFTLNAGADDTDIYVARLRP